MTHDARIERAGSSAQPGFHQSSIDPIWFYCSVAEVDYLKAEAEVRRTGKRVADMPVTLILGDGSSHPDKGKFVFLDRTVDPNRRPDRVRLAARREGAPPTVVRRHLRRWQA